jgi:hypothetical protein
MVKNTAKLRQVTINIMSLSNKIQHNLIFILGGHISVRDGINGEFSLTHFSFSHVSWLLADLTLSCL